ncbi:MAG: alpha/beta hydrolase [Candidatus Eisenbacteria bacterium]|nr:alpha/beta hydrolase [Candidatus Eisenbacteria bacterium]
MISNRNVTPNGLGRTRKALSYWVTDGPAVEEFRSWEKVSADAFQRILAEAAGAYPLLEMEQHEEQKHVTLFVHGYNNTWDGAARAYRSIADHLFTGQASMGTCVLFTWPSNGSPVEYLADRGDAAASAPDLAGVLEALYDWLVERQTVAVRRPELACRAKTSMIAHSMGNYVLQKAMQAVWTRKNQPLLVSLLNQLLMVAADVDNDLFASGETVDRSDGDAIANLTYRVSVLYTGLDEILGVSAGLKHFGKRRLGRSGLDPAGRVPDNVWQVDCTRYFDPRPPHHGAYFTTPAVLDLMRQILRGTDRGVLTSQWFR